ncbi:MAG: hypothetical protein HUU50_02605 [Candidatus Brocadiae bacterium]|nr:hypothetical protein [Candidatus Brocadiia bacterium]
MQSDIDQLVSSLATHIDETVIDQKFQDGFPGHKLTPRTIKKKGHDRVGEDTGALRKAATLWTNWSIWPTTIGGHRPAMVKRRHGLTAYASMIKTKEGGPVDFLGIEPGDIVKMQGFIRAYMSKKGYKGEWKIRLQKKETGE